jgi:hypothetical protein
LPSPVTVKIKVQPYIRKYLIGKSENKEEPLVFAKNHPFGKLLIKNVTIYNRHTSFPITDKDCIHDYFYSHWKTCESVKILLPFNEDKDVRCYNYLSYHSQRDIISKLKEYFYHELHWFLISRRRKGTQRKDIIFEFMENYNITEDDILFESVYRQTTRILQPFL